MYFYSYSNNICSNTIYSKLTCFTIQFNVCIIARSIINP
nr:MAG TPA: hypothetical protein [Crassvirales sp.]